MSTEQLIIELDARTAKLDAKLKATDKKMEALDGTVKKTDGSLGSFSKVASGVGKGLRTVTSLAKKAAAAFLVVRGAVTAAALASAKHAKEIKNSASLMRLSVEDAQALASATQTVGIDINKLGDISKDTSEKIGQFLTMGGGGFEDFGDAMGYTKEQTLEAAKSFKGLAGSDVLQSMVTQMEAAGVNADAMSFALEGMASDTTALIPLLKDGGAVLNKLKDDFRETAVVLTETDIEKLGELSTSFKQLGETFDGTMGKFSVEYAGQINGMIDTTQEGLKIIGDEFASGAFTDRINSFYTAFTDSWATAMGDNIDVFDGFSVDAGEVISSLAALWLDTVLTMPINFAIAGSHIKEIFMDILDSVKMALGEANLLIQEGLSFVGLDSDVEGAQALLDSINIENDARDEAHDSEIARLEAAKAAILEKFHLEQETATATRDQYAKDSENRLKSIEAEDRAERKRVAGKKKGHGLETKSSAEQMAAEEKGKKDLTKNAQVLNEILFNDNKAIGAGIIIAETAQNVVTSVKNSGGVPWGLPAGAAAAAMGISQLAALKGSSKGGGSIQAASVAVPSQQQPDFQPESSSLEFTDTTDTGQTTFNLTVPDGDEIGQALANWINKAQTEGRT
jgi:hypothetical protein